MDTWTHTYTLSSPPAKQANKAADCSGKERHDGGASKATSTTLQMTYFKQPSNKAINFTCLRTIRETT
jgi:hypothetical protein